MGKWNQLWMTGINTLIKLKVPVQTQFKDAQRFSTNLDEAEELNNELLEIKAKAETLKKERDQKHQALKSLIGAINSKIPDYDKSNANLLRVMEKDKNNDGRNACIQVQGGLNRVDGLVKDPISLRFDIVIK
jgi:hypothetical protein